MKSKYIHKGVKPVTVLNRYTECFGPGTKAYELKVPEEQINMVCAMCKNVTCSRSGKGRTGFDQRMMAQVDYLLNNPIFSDLASAFHKEISSLEVPNLKQKVEGIIINSKIDHENSGWDTADIRPDSSILSPIPNLKLVSSTKAKETLPEKQVDSSLPPKKLTNTPMPSGGIMIGGGSLPSSTPIADPWADADKLVEPGAVIKVKGS